MFMFVAASAFNLYPHAMHIDISQSELGIPPMPLYSHLWSMTWQVYKKEKFYGNRCKVNFYFKTLRHTLICILWLRVQKASLQLQSITPVFINPSWNKSCWCHKVSHLSLNTFGKKLFLFNVPTVKKLPVKQAKKTTSKPRNSSKNNNSKQSVFETETGIQTELLLRGGSH